MATIELNKESEFGPIHCIEGLPFEDMTPYAPNAGWRSSFPTGRAAFAEVTGSCAVADQHLGGKFSASTSSKTSVAFPLAGAGLDPGFSGTWLFRGGDPRHTMALQLLGHDLIFVSTKPAAAHGCHHRCWSGWSCSANPQF